MKDIMIFATGVQLEIEDGASLGAIIHIAADEAAAVEACGAVTAEALSLVQFSKDGTVYGEYEDLTKAAEPSRQTNEDGTVTVTISLREKTDVELRLDSLEESQALQDGAIDDLGGVVSEMMEG